MNSTELCYMSAGQLSRLYSAKEVSPVEVVDAQLARINATEPALNSFITLLPEAAQAAARRAETEIQAGKHRGPLHGIPVGLKDLYNTAGVRTTSGSRIFDNFVPQEDCTVAARLLRAGAILLGKLNMHPLAYGPTGENSDYGHMHNPWDPEVVAGGSSGGSGSAVAAGQCTIATGSDTGGSIRIPAALCGIVGFKPTYGLVSKHGLTPLAWSLDHPGPMTRTVEDAALAMNAIAGHDPKDPASARANISDYAGGLTGDIRGLRVGVPKEYFEAPLDQQVERSVRTAIDVLADRGAVVAEVSFPMFTQSDPISTAIIMAEAAAYYRDLLATDADRIYPPVRLRLEAGLFISAADYLRAQQARSMFNDQAHRLLEQVDLLAGPTEPVTAPKLLANRVQAGGAHGGHGNGVDPVHAGLQHYRFPGSIRSLRILGIRAAHRAAIGGPAI